MTGDNWQVGKPAPRRTPLEMKVQQNMKKASSTGRRENSVSLADEDQVKEVLAGAVLGLWDVVNNLTRLRPAKPGRYRVTIFGSARTRPGTFGYDETKRC